MNGFEGIKGLIKRKSDEIRKRTSTGIHEEDNFKRLLVSCTSYKDKRPFTGILSIIISIDNIKNSQSASIETLYSSIDECISLACNHVTIDSNYAFVEADRIHYSCSNNLREIYRDLSKDGYCVILISQEFSTYFINGDVVGDAIFFTKEDLERFQRRKEITELKDLFDEYRIHITLRPVYQNFFVPNSGKKALFGHLLKNGEIKDPGQGKALKQSEKKFLDKFQNLLHNKPEDRFRENLRKFLDDRLKGTVSISKEYILENFKRIDIFINDEFGELYLIEVKWIGLSIHASGTKLGTKFDPSDINPDGIEQTIEYLAELYKHKEDVKVGYLVVFDARNGENDDSVPDFDPSNLPKEIADFYHRFEKIDDFRVNNQHPN